MSALGAGLLLAFIGGLSFGFGVTSGEVGAVLTGLACFIMAAYMRRVMLTEERALLARPTEQTEESRG